MDKTGSAVYNASYTAGITCRPQAFEGKHVSESAGRENARRVIFLYSCCTDPQQNSDYVRK